MKELFFWKDWYRSYQIPYFVLLCCFVISVCAFLFFYYTGVDWSIDWRVETNTRSIKHTIDEINVGVFAIPIEGEMPLTEQKFAAENLKIVPWAYPVYGAILAFVMISLITVLTSLRQIWFALGMTIFVFFLAYLNFDFLQALPYRNGVLVIAMLIYLPLAYYFNTFGKTTALYQRFLVFGVLTIVFFAWLFTSSKVTFPAMYLVNYGIMIPVILTLVFISMISHDILYGFFILIVRYNAEGGKSNMRHFTVITLFYLANLILLYLRMRGIWEVDMYLVDVYWLILVASVIGIWGFQQRNILISRILPFEPQGAYFYISMAILSFCTMGFFFLTGNDAMTDVFHDFTLFSFIAFGIVFYLYIGGNFSQLMSEGLPVEKITYQGVMFPYNVLKYFGFVMIIGFLTFNNQIQLYQAIGGFYNGLGDTYLAHRDFKLAKINYDQAYVNDVLSHHANYALTTLADLEKNPNEKLFFLKNAVERQPSEQAYVRLSNEYLDLEKPFEALFQLREGIRKFPKSTEIHNNLALLYAKNNVLDSTLYHLTVADKYAGNLSIPQNNLWAYLAENGKKDTQLGNLDAIKDEKSNKIGKANKLALYNRFDTFLQFKDNKNTISGNDELNFALMYNFTLNRLGRKDTLINSQIQTFYKKDSLAKYLYRTQFVEACYEYYQGNVDKGIQILASIPIITSDAYYNTILGLWLLEQECHGNALYYLQRAIDLGNQQAVFYKAIVLSEAKDFRKAFETWQEVKTQTAQSKENIQLANKILKVLQDSVQLDDDSDKYNLIHYKKYIVPSKILLEVYAEMQDATFKTKAAAELMQYFIQEGNNKEAERIYQTAKNFSQSNPFAKSELNYAYLQLLLAKKEYDKLLNEVDKINLSKIHRNKKAYLKASVYDRQNKLKEAETQFSQAVISAPFSEEVLLASAKFFQEKKKDTEKAYRILVEGVRANAFSIPLYQAYALQCLEMGLEDYGDTALEQLKQNQSAEAFEQFKKIYEEKKMAKSFRN